MLSEGIVHSFFLSMAIYRESEKESSTFHENLEFLSNHMRMPRLQKKKTITFTHQTSINPYNIRFITY
jgi:hypothetical protein